MTKNLDRWLAEYLMGWVDGGYWWYDKDGNKTGYHQSELDLDGCLWRPTQDITQALGDGGPGTVVGVMGEKGFSLELIRNISVDPPVSFVEFFQHNQQGLALVGYSAEAPTPAPAICEAAKAALEGK